ncbi:hypothetical protein [Sphingomonas corticis]|jgi:hypothetical protein|uniref:Uncharacterized protein n=1 Tax=Sphingomonas corticis TaxID=2722791 RepID=A0ABX1CND8_9SPHN|nr:hypothetical protein [Sphingomonas corticis]NJR79429.1 hypothetical protein [Sphingomonas corticis]
MLAGLIFATHEAEDRAGTLAATLPFAAATLIEYQARLLIACDAAQIVVVVQRLTPELIGAIARIGKRGVAVDTVRSAREAEAKLHPLARVVMIADGLVTTGSIVEVMAGVGAGEGGDALLVVPRDGADPAFEQVGGGSAWAGVARIEARRVAEAAAMPADYDLQSTLLRAAEAAGARHVPLSMREVERGHGVERQGAALEARGRAVLAASMALRPGWFDRIVLRPLARLAIPAVARRGIGTGTLMGGGGALAVAGLLATLAGWTASGLLATMAGVLTIEIGGALALFRDEPDAKRAGRIAALVLPALAVLVLGHVSDGATGELTGGLLAIATVVAGGIGERAAVATRRRAWWGGGPAYLLLLSLAALVGLPRLGLAATAAYAAVTLGAAVEALRRQA